MPERVKKFCCHYNIVMGLNRTELKLKIPLAENEVWGDRAACSSRCPYGCPGKTCFFVPSEMEHCSTYTYVQHKEKYYCQSIFVDGNFSYGEILIILASFVT